MCWTSTSPHSLSRACLPIELRRATASRGLELFHYKTVSKMGQMLRFIVFFLRASKIKTLLHLALVIRLANTHPAETSMLCLPEVVWDQARQACVGSA
jgi:hypothetical protein